MIELKHVAWCATSHYGSYAHRYEVGHHVLFCGDRYVITDIAYAGDNNTLVEMRRERDGYVCILTTDVLSNKYEQGDVKFED